MGKYITKINITELQGGKNGLQVFIPREDAEICFTGYKDLSKYLTEQLSKKDLDRFKDDGQELVIIITVKRKQ